MSFTGLPVFFVIYFTLRLEYFIISFKALAELYEFRDPVGPDVESMDE